MQFIHLISLTEDTHHGTEQENFEFGSNQSFRFYCHGGVTTR